MGYIETLLATPFAELRGGQVFVMAMILILFNAAMLDRSNK